MNKFLKLLTGPAQVVVLLFIILVLPASCSPHPFVPDFYYQADPHYRADLARHQRDNSVIRSTVWHVTGRLCGAQEAEQIHNAISK